MTGCTAQLTEVPEGPLAVSAAELEEWGCPRCGHMTGNGEVSYMGTTSWCCGACRYGFYVLEEGLTASSIGVIRTGKDVVYPALQDHPRRGIPSHEARIEHFRVQHGIGVESDLLCFACGFEGEGYLNNITAHVQSIASGGRVVSFFDSVHGGARLSVRDFEPDNVRVFVGGCMRHVPHLVWLTDACSDGFISQEKIQAVVSKQ